MELDDVHAAGFAVQAIHVLRDQGKRAALRKQVLLERRQCAMSVVGLRPGELFSPITRDRPERFGVDARNQARSQLWVRRPKTARSTIRPEPRGNRNSGSCEDDDLARHLRALAEWNVTHGFTPSLS